MILARYGFRTYQHYIFLIEDSFYRPENSWQANSQVSIGKKRSSESNAVDQTINRIATIVIFYYGIVQIRRGIGKEQLGTNHNSYICIVDFSDPKIVKHFRHAGFFGTQGWTLLVLE